MKTDDLVAALVADTRAAPPLARQFRHALPLVLSGAGLAMVVVLALTLGLRPGVGAVLASTTAVKTVLPLVLALAALALLLRGARPLPGSGGWGLALLVVTGAICAGLVGATLWALPVAAWRGAALGPSIPVCLTMIPLLAVLPGIGLLAVLRNGAAMSPAMTGMWAGLAAGALAAAVYSLHCDEDSVLFFVPWYGAGIVLAALAGRLAGARLLRW